MAGPVSSHEITLNNLEYDKMGESDPKNLKLLQRRWVFVTNSNCIILIYLQPYGLDL